MATLLLGNGINNLSNNLSWKDLLKDLIRDIGKEEVIKFGKKPYLHLYEEIFTRAIKHTGNNENDIKNKIVDKLKVLQRDRYNDDILNLGFDNILTTNYDYNLTPDIKESLVPTVKTKEIKHSLYRFQKATNGTKVWHIHGEINKPSSIMIGYEHYMSSIQNMQKHLYKIENKDKDMKYSWLNVFLEEDIYILGLGLDFGEYDLWYLLAYRNRLIQKNERNNPIRNKIVFITGEKDQGEDELDNCLNRYSNRNDSEREEVKNNIHKLIEKQNIEKELKAKEEMLEVFGVQIKTIRMNNSNERYRNLYREAFNYLSNELENNNSSKQAIQLKLKK